MTRVMEIAETQVAARLAETRIIGVRTVRVFPAALLGRLDFLAAVASVYPDMRFIPSGGIGPESLRGYLRRPSVLAVAGDGLVRKDLLRAQNYERMEWLAGKRCAPGVERFPRSRFAHTDPPSWSYEPVAVP
jgi:2-dehydro-3-deoxyphosphogluconate aldolase/(4S)-4-hydroxy-2-oxoglutarate aldolase